MKQAREAGNARLFFTHDVRGSELIYEIADNPTLRRLLKGLEKQALRYRYHLYRNDSSVVDLSFDDTARVFRAIVDGERSRPTRWSTISSRKSGARRAMRSAPNSERGGSVIEIEAAFPYIDTHTAGHPTRAVLGGIPPLRGRSVLEKREDFERRFDHLRSALLHEPRGHAAMVGLIPVPSEVADFGAIFISSYVYLGMCGHGTIGFAKTLAFTGAISPDSGDRFTLETPAGVVDVRVEWDEAGRLGAVSLKNVPAYMGLEGLGVDVPGLGRSTRTSSIRACGMRWWTPTSWG